MHKLQLFDISVFKSLNSNYNQEVRSWLKSHPGKPATEYQFAELIAAAHGQATTVTDAVGYIHLIVKFPVMKITWQVM